MRLVGVEEILGDDLFYIETVNYTTMVQFHSTRLNKCHWLVA